MVRFIKKYFPSFLIALIIMWLSLSDSKDLNPGKFFNFPNSDKVAHFIIYLFFTFMLLLNSSDWKFSGHIKYVLIIIPALFGLSMEFLQYLVTATRQAEALDLLANISGVAVATILILIVNNSLRPGKA